MSDYIVIHGIKVHKDYANFVPETFGRLTTIGPKFILGKITYQVYQCSCEARTVFVSRMGDVRSGRTQSCKCLNREIVAACNKTHGKSGSPEHRIWKGIMVRCYNRNCKGYTKYGGRGIGVCARWREPNGQGFLNFVEDMGPRPGPEYSVDRYPIKDGNYEPGNCRWATIKEQNRNRRSNRVFTLFGKTQCLMDWTLEYGINYGTIQDRLATGMDIETALTKEVKRNAKKNT